MIAANLLTDSLIPLRTSDTGDEALSMMSDFYVKHLPIVNNEELLGLISEEDILDNDAMEAVGSYPLSLARFYVRDTDHIYEVMRLLAEYKLTVIPVVDEKSSYLGMISQEDLINYFAATGSFTEPGSIIVLEMHRRDYSLAEIARIAESENANIVSSFISATGVDESLIDVTLKINLNSIQGLLATFDRFGYQVKASFNESDYFDTLKERYDALMMFLNV